jgi:EmrB/QacA subfamily drug resistance transporter
MRREMIRARPRPTPAAATVGGWRRLLVEPARPSAIAARRDAHWLVVSTVCLGAFMGQLDASIVTFAFPTFRHDFHATLGAVQWVGLTYLLVQSSFVVAVGHLADMVGRKLLYTYGFAVFIAGSALCGLAPSLAALDGFRAVQAAGAAMLQANSVAIVRLAMPPDELGRGLGVQGAAQAVGLSLGPAVGGLLVALGSWRWIFFVNVPVGVVGTVAAWFLIPRSRHLRERAPFDWLGLALFVPALAALLGAVSFGNELGWSSARIATLLVVGVGLLATFVARERRARAPMLDLGLFSDTGFSAGIASGLLSYLVLFGALFATPFFLQDGRGLAPTTTGVTLMALPAGMGLVAPLSGRVVDVVGARALTVGGMLLSAAASAALAFLHSSVPLVVVELAFLGAGLGAFTPANNATVMGAAPTTLSGLTGGILNLTRGLGTSLGLALTALVLGLVAGAHAKPELVARGFTTSMIFLAAVAVAAALLAAVRDASSTARGRPRRRQPRSLPPPPLRTRSAPPTRADTR